MALEVVILAAGKGTRMRSETPKVLHRLGGVPLLQHVLTTARSLGPERIHLVYGRDGNRLRALPGSEDVHWVLQGEQLGTGHALRVALPGIDDGSRVLVLYGDVPLIHADTLRRLVGPDDGLSVLTADLEPATGYGRILRDGQGRVVGIVEERDASPEQKALTEVNTGFLSAPARSLADWLARLEANNAQNEYYLTDVVALAVADGATVLDFQPDDTTEILGVNTRGDLARLERIFQRGCAAAFMDQGVTIADPNRFDARGPVEIGADSIIDVNVILEGPLTIGARVHIGPNTLIARAMVADDVTVHAHCVIEGAEIGRAARIGPFARIRPDTKLGPQSHVGNFVEVKNSTMAAGSKANHLSYIGDSSVGRDVNVGAGVITCNYDGAEKHRTDIGDDVFVGSNSQLVAPVKIGAGATIGAGSTITQDVPKGALALTRTAQRVVAHWQRPRKKPKVDP